MYKYSIYALLMVAALQSFDVCAMDATEKIKNFQKRKEHIAHVNILFNIKPSLIPTVKIEDDYLRENLILLEGSVCALEKKHILLGG